MADHDQTTPERDELQGRRNQQEDVGSSLGVQGEDPSFEAGAEGDGEDDQPRTSATLSPTDGGVTGQGGGVENADFASSGGTREQNLGRSDQAGTGAAPEGGIQQDRSQR